MSQKIKTLPLVDWKLRAKSRFLLILILKRKSMNHELSRMKFVVVTVDTFSSLSTLITYSIRFLLNQNLSRLFSSWKNSNGQLKIKLSESILPMNKQNCKISIHFYRSDTPCIVNFCSRKSFYLLAENDFCRVELQLTCTILHKHKYIRAEEGFRPVEYSWRTHLGRLSNRTNVT